MHISGLESTSPVGLATGGNRIGGLASEAEDAFGQFFARILAGNGTGTGEVGAFGHAGSEADIPDVHDAGGSPNLYGMSNEGFDLLKQSFGGYLDSVKGIGGVRSDSGVAPGSSRSAQFDWAYSQLSGNYANTESWLAGRAG